MEKEGKHVILMSSLIRPSSYTPGEARQRRIILKTPVSQNSRQGRRTVTSASSRLRRSRRETESDPYSTENSRQNTKDLDLHDVPDDELIEKRKQKLERPKVMQKMYEKACNRFKVVPVRQYLETPDTHNVSLPNYNLGTQGVQALATPLMDKGFSIDLTHQFEDLAYVIAEDKRAIGLDSGNIKLTYNSLIEKAEAREKERLKEEARKLRKIESSFRNLLKSGPAQIDESSRWEDVREKLEKDSAYQAVTVESERIRLFREYQQILEESCSHHHSRKKKTKKHKTRRSRSKSKSQSESEAETVASSSRHRKKKKERKHRSESRSRSPSNISESDHERDDSKKKHKKKSKKKKHVSRSPSKSSLSGGEEHSKKKKKDKNEQETRKEKANDWASSGSDLSEGELEKKRRLLLQQLEADA
ncbi:PRP40 [Mytilus edulis]|uniref:PRPF40 n=1 Tax=Mytilus edulis TaxID=6550 RepID=A0A8S3U6Y9_MYTED|nr:PRP40 [Mytilus edulis]